MTSLVARRGNRIMRSKRVRYIDLRPDHSAPLDTERLEPVKHAHGHVVGYGVMQAGERIRIHNGELVTASNSQMVIQVDTRAAQEDRWFFDRVHPCSATSTRMVP